MNKPLIPKRHAVADFSGLRQKNKQPSLQGESLCYSSQQCVDTASQSRAFFFKLMETHPSGQFLPLLLLGGQVLGSHLQFKLTKLVLSAHRPAGT